MSANPALAPDREPSVTDGILDALACLDVGDRADAAALIDKAIDRVIAALRRDPRIPRLSTIEFELLLADARNDIERDIAAIVAGTVDLDEVVEAVTEASFEDDEAST